MSETVAEDWVALWRSELTAMAADRELRESWAAMVAFWAGAAITAAGAPQQRHDHPAGTARAAQPAWPSPAAAASVPGLDEIASLNRRIAVLERRLAAFERNQPAGD